jgi:3-carboxy-cis,cis-muconate cycloisomerase
MAGVAGALASSLFTAMRTVHERAAGEWHIEWYVLPELARLAAGALFWSVDVASGLRVFPDSMLRNLELDGGLVLAEAYMMRLAASLGRERAHDLVYEAATNSRKTGRSLLDVLRSLAPPEASLALAELGGGVRAEDYLGDVAFTCRAAVAAWRG